VKRVAPYATLRKRVTASYPRSQAINKAYPSRPRATRTVVPDRVARSRRQMENAFNSGAMHQRTGISKSLNASVRKEEPGMRSIPIALAAFVISGPAAAQRLRRVGRNTAIPTMLSPSPFRPIRRSKLRLTKSPITAQSRRKSIRSTGTTAFSRSRWPTSPIPVSTKGRSSIMQSRRCPQVAR
jgi:hypothetical protein